MLAQKLLERGFLLFVELPHPPEANDRVGGHLLEPGREHGNRHRLQFIAADGGQVDERRVAHGRVRGSGTSDRLATHPERIAAIVLNDISRVKSWFPAKALP